MTKSSCSEGRGEKSCGPGRYELSTDLYADSDGLTRCANGKRSLCCDKSQELDKCYWTTCVSNELNDLDICNKGQPTSNIKGVPVTWRGDQENGARCPEGSNQIFCCPSEDTYLNCQWKPYIGSSSSVSAGSIGSGFMAQCYDQECSDTQVTIARAGLPERMPDSLAVCYPYSSMVKHRYCCDPPWKGTTSGSLKSTLGEDKGIFHPYQKQRGGDDNTAWSGESGIEDDPHGFVALDGPEEALQDKFADYFEIVHEFDGDLRNPRKMMSLATSDKETLDQTFTHEESTHLVYCKPTRKDDCSRVFKGGATDTIIKLPNYIGFGPFARIVSMESTLEDNLPENHRLKRIHDGNKGAVYNLTFDYDFHLVKRDETVNIRMEYTNIIQDQGKSTNNPNLLKQKRTGGEETYSEWIRRINEKVLASDKGFKPISQEKSLLLYNSQVQCPIGVDQISFRSDFEVKAKIKYGMNAEWAYHIAGTIVPFKLNKSYIYLGITPSAELTVEINGNSELRYPLERIKLMDTISYPGVSVKGIAVVQPSLDLWGTMAGRLAVSGTLGAGVKIQYPRYVMYYPIDEVAQKNEIFGMDATTVERAEVGLVPEVILAIKFGVQLVTADKRVMNVATSKARSPEYSS
ncbi:hypothetical protein TWF730_008088 [Orbilia blumenaviensis]|uniref:Uncharacterized protein n=1 Tax=Orbilia blumenaviensis TaxID=1796055 RepID=A0AAV9VCG2_9PEZI